VAYLVFKLLDNGQQVWLKRLQPARTWGPRHQAKRYRTKPEAQQALAGLSVPDRKAASVLGDA
jgi:hypothetical protein